MRDNEKVKDDFQKTMEESIIKLDSEDREGKFNRFMLIVFACIFLCIFFTAVIIL